MTSRAGQALIAEYGHVSRINGDGDRIAKHAAAIEQEVRDEIRARVERDVLPLIVGTESEVRAGLAVLRMVVAAISSSSATETQDGLPDANRVGGYSAYGEPYAEDAYDGATETQDGERPDPARAFAYWFAAQPHGIQRRFIHDWIDRHEPEPGPPYNESPQPTPTPDDRDRRIKWLEGEVRRLAAIVGEAPQVYDPANFPPEVPDDRDREVERIAELEDALRLAHQALRDRERKAGKTIASDVALYAHATLEGLRMEPRLAAIDAGLRASGGNE